MKIKTDFPKFWPILWLCTIALVVMGAALSPSNLDPTQFTNSGPVNGQPFMSLKDGAVGTNVTINNITNVNLFSSNIFATNITVNEFKGRTEFVTNLNATFITNQTLITTNAFITYLTNITAYVTNLFAVTEYVTNLNVTYLTNQTFYTTNVFATTVNAVTNINNIDITTNLFVSNVFATNITVDLITNNTFFTTNILATTINATTNFNTFNFSTNLFSTNIITTNLFSTFITNQTFYSTNIYTTNLTANYITNNTSIITNLYVSNVFATNITVDVLTNNLFVTSNTFTTNLYVSNIFTTNITLMEAIWNTNKWNGPTNDVSFKATYQKFVASTDMEITGLIDSSPSNANTSVLLITPGGANRTLYFPAVFTNYTSDGNNAYLIPSTNVATVTLFQYGNQNTNVVFRLFGPGTATSQLWTNSAGVITQVGSTNVQVGGLDAINTSANLLAYNAPIGNTAGKHNSIYVGGVNDMLFGVSGMASVQGTQFSGDSSTNGVVEGESAGLVGNNGGLMSLQYGVVGLSTPFAVVGGTNVGVAGSAIAFGSSGTFVGGYFAEAVDDTTKPHLVNAALIADSLATGDPPQLWRTNGDTTVASMNASGTLSLNGIRSVGSNYFGGSITGPTNSSGTAPDMSKSSGCSLLSTNAAFAWLVPTSVDTTKTVQQWVEILVTNTTASAVAMTVTAPCTAVGTPYVTNLTDVWVMVYPFVCTNFYFIPCR